MASERLPSFIRRDGKSLLYNGDGEFIFYVPEMLFDRKDAFLVGEYVNLLGLLDYQVIDGNNKATKIRPFNFPSVFLCKPSNVTKEKKLKLNKFVDPQDYRILHFVDGDAIVVDTSVPQDIEHVEDFYKIFLCGKLPTTIPYDKLQDYFYENMAINGESYGITIQMFGFVISEICRSKTNLSIPFRNTKYEDPTEYRAISIKDLPKYISPNSSIGSENWDNGVVGAIVHPTDTSSPMEKLVMGGYQNSSLASKDG